MKLLDTFSQDGFYLTQSYFNNPTYYGKFGLLGHEGVDFGHTNKTVEVRSPLSGQCLTAYHSVYGRYVIVIDYDQGCAVWLCHLSSASIVSGQEIKAGDIIGKMGSSGNSTGPHVHLNFCLVDKNGVRLYKEKQYNQGYLDPLHPLDTSTPKKLVEYNVEWVKDLNMSDTITIPVTQNDFYVGRATILKEFAIFLKLDGDPDKVSLETLKNVIAGIKARTTDIEKQKGVAKANLIVAQETISSLKGQLLSGDKILKELNINLKTTKARTKGLEGELQGMINAKGIVATELAECQAKRDHMVKLRIKDWFIGKYK